MPRTNPPKQRRTREAPIEQELPEERCETCAGYCRLNPKMGYCRYQIYETNEFAEKGMHPLVMRGDHCNLWVDKSEDPTAGQQIRRGVRARHPNIGRSNGTKEMGN